jgi:hypothetical protein
MDHGLDRIMVKRVLMIAFHYPPLRGSSGIQRTLKFSGYLPEHGWQPVVLSAHLRAYESTADDQLGEIPADVPVHRAFALDASRHLSVRRRYLELLALPDRWVSWWLGAVPTALQLVRRHRPEVIWSTYPIATAHLIALTVSRLTGIPWIADMRDPMTDDDVPRERLTRWARRWVERQAIRHSTRVICTTPGTIAMYRRRFPDIPPSRFCLIENGYDEENFQAAQHAAGGIAERAHQPFVLLHSGCIYPSERDPTHFFDVLADLVRERQLGAADLQVILRATGHDAHLRQLIDERDIGAVVTLAPPIAYKAALAEMLGADGLLLLQGRKCNQQIPAKLYEYLRARRPILALTDADSDTGMVLRRAGIDTVAPLDSPDDIRQALLQFLHQARSGQAPIASLEAAQLNSRRARSGELAALLDDTIAAVSRAAPAGAGPQKSL